MFDRVQIEWSHVTHDRLFGGGFSREARFPQKFQLPSIGQESAEKKTLQKYVFHDL